MQAVFDAIDITGFATAITAVCVAFIGLDLIMLAKRKGSGVLRRG